MSKTPLIDTITNIRVNEPERVQSALTDRPRGQQPNGDKPLMIIACDHAARGALAAGGNPMAMGSREELLRRCVEALTRPGVDGFLGTADLIEDLALLGALDNKLVYGSMNRGGLAGATFEMDDRFTGYTPHGIASAGLDGGKMLLRINYEDAGSVQTLENCARAVEQLAEQKVMAMVEPFISERKNGRIVNGLSPEAVIKSMAIASGLASTSAYTWLKLPVVEDMERVMEASTLPALILGGEVRKDAEAAMEGWGKALELPNVKGLVIGRSLLFPPDDDVAAAVDATVQILNNTI
ncbi:deoxyribose-phosphate aldolase [Actinomyces sp. HMSC065F11]|uniref:Cgl0159 family (beta/alpha)8-fold protein n=1 Tax=Actinomyces sp. HMSC065F11 TaxID=1739395 RepID=UPI0008A1A74B|nr:deoxyribose-phosphate aldolase [Actinomyces sp. HMSC065F11]OFR33672.1 deoxyribose-phosphate aldolase [Actinomyces sp. HMSC065F11]